MYVRDYEVPVEKEQTMKYLLSPLIIFIGLFFIACTSQKSEPIFFGKDSCHQCKMQITDSRFGGELVSAKGKVYKFDSLDCMKKFKEQHPDNYKEYVVDALNKGNLIEAEKAFFILNNEVRSPMGGAGIFASEDEKKLSHLAPQGSKATEVFQWTQVTQYLTK